MKQTRRTQKKAGDSTLENTTAVSNHGVKSRIKEPANKASRKVLNDSTKKSMLESNGNKKEAPTKVKGKVRLLIAILAFYQLLNYFQKQAMLSKMSDEIYQTPSTRVSDEVYQTPRSRVGLRVMNT